MLSFFENNNIKGTTKTNSAHNGQPSSSTGVIISRVMVKKPMPKPLGSISQPSLLINSSSRSSPTASYSALKSRSQPGPSSLRTSSSKPNGHSQVDKRTSSHNRSRLEVTSSSRPSRSPIPKRKTPSSRVQSESESESESESSDDGVKPKQKRKRVTAGTVTPLPKPMPGEEDIERDVFCLDQVDERGEFGRGWVGFVGSEEIVRGITKGWATGDAVGKAELDKYVPYFPQAGFEKGETLPSVELLYPAKGCREKFILLAPSSPREYSPITELRNSLRIILDHYIPPSHQHIFGTLSDSMPDLDPTSLSIPSRFQSPFPAFPATPPPDSSPASVLPSETIGDALRKALAPNRRDGPGFLRAMDRYNTAMEEIQADVTLVRWMASRPSMKAKEWSGLVDAIHDNAYSRIVGRYSYELAHPPKLPAEIAATIEEKEDTYGELRHVFMSKIIEQTKLNPQSVFVDLGSGVGNCVMQAALQAGCRSYGFELLPVPAHCARLQLREVQRRWAMWGLKGNLDIEVHEGDFTTHPLVPKIIKAAHVVLVNNEVFTPALNDRLKDLFLDLKEGAIIVSLKPFVPDGFRMNESNCDSFAAIVKMTQHTYHTDWSSWKSGSGEYYIQVIDHKRRADYEESLNGRRKR